MQWTPDNFWKSTMHEFTAANNGYLNLHQPESNALDNAATRTDLAMLQDKIDKKVKANG